MTPFPLDGVYTQFATTKVNSTGVATDADSTPTFDVFEDTTATPILAAQNAVKPTGKTGVYYASFTCSAANGFDVGKCYNVVLSATVSTIVQKQAIASFRLVPAEANAGYPKVNAWYVRDTLQTGRDLGASVLLSPGTGTGQVDLTSGVVKANWVQVLATALTEGATGRLAAGFKQFFNVATPVSTMEAITIVGTVTNLTNAPTTGNLTAAMKASVNAEVLDVMSVDNHGEPTGVPGATVSWGEKLDRIYMVVRNKLTVTSGVKTFYDDSGTAEWKKNLSDDGTTYTEGEGISP